MTLIRSFRRGVPFAAWLAVPMIAVPALTNAQERTLFTMRTTVDREVVITMRGSDIRTRASGQDAAVSPQVELRESLPLTSGEIHVHVADGRGQVDVLEHPSARNDYTAIVRITDPRAGADRYRIVASWRPVRNDNSRDGPRGRDDRGRDDRGRDDDRRDDRGRADAPWWWPVVHPRTDGQLRWTGDIDDVSEIHVRGRHVEYRTLSGHVVRNARHDLAGSGLPRRDTQVSVELTRGRGHVEIVQQPRRHNGYTAIIRIVDRRSGYGFYDFDLFW